MKYIVFLFLLTFSTPLIAQNLQGRVVDSVTGEEIPFASVNIVGTNFSTVTNENGYFVIKPPAQPFKVRISHVSYNTTEILVNEVGEVLTLKLKPATITLAEITIDPFRGQRILKEALEKAASNANENFYANAFYRQLTSLNGKASQIYELFYDLRWNTQRVQGWSAKQSRYAELNEEIAFSLNNQSYLTFSYGGYLLPNKGGKFVSLTTFPDFEITIDKYIEQVDQNIAVITCKYKKGKRNSYYVNSTYYIGVEDFKIYRLENSVFNLPIRLTEATAKFPPVVSTVATFNSNGQQISVLESISTKLYLSLSVRGKTLNSNISSLLTVYNIDESLKEQQFEALSRNTKDRAVIEAIPYDPIFWKNNPIVKQTTLEDSFIKMMESKAAFGTMTNP